MSILMSGGSGLLGSELKKYLDLDAPSREELDITKKITKKKKYDLIIHAAAYTNVDKAEVEIEKCFKTNILGTVNLVEAYPNTPFVYISSEYVNRPINVYSYSKLAGEIIVEEKAKAYCIIRTLFKEKPWRWAVAWLDQMTQGDYVDVIAKMMVDFIAEWDKKTSVKTFLGTGRKSMYDLALKTNPRVKAVYYKRVKRPMDYL